MKRYGKVALGGTFDQLHEGHKRLIEQAFQVGKRVLIGLTTKQMLEVYPKTHDVEDFAQRKKEIYDFLEARGMRNRVNIVAINDPYGPAITDGEIEALIVSHETVSQVEEINRRRRERGLNALEAVVVEFVLAENGYPISSSRIRQNEIDRGGRCIT